MAEQATVHEAAAEHAARRQALPDENGFFGKYGGQYLPPQLEGPFAEITRAYHEIENDASFIAELRYLRKHFQGRPTPVYHARTLSLANGGAQIYLKREDLNPTGAHKLNHCMGEGLLAKYMGKKKLIAETGAGQHGVALATAAAHFGLECEIHMGEVDIEKQAPNVSRMQLLGATVVPVSHGLKTLKEAVDSAFEAYLADPVDSIYCIGSVVGPHPFPLMVRDFQKVVGIEARGGEVAGQVGVEQNLQAVALVDGFAMLSLDVHIVHHHGGQKEILLVPRQIEAGAVVFGAGPVFRPEGGLAERIGHRVPLAQVAVDGGRDRREDGVIDETVGPRQLGGRRRGARRRRQGGGRDRAGGHGGGGQRCRRDRAGRLRRGAGR